MTLFTANGSTKNSRLRTLRLFFLVTGQLLLLVSGIFNFYYLVLCSFSRVKLDFISTCINIYSCFWYLGTLKRSHGVRLEPNLLLSPLEFSLTRKKPLPTWRSVIKCLNAGFVFDLIMVYILLLVCDSDISILKRNYRNGFSVCCYLSYDRFSPKKKKKIKNKNKRKKINKDIIVFCESNFLFYFHYVGFSILLPILMFGCMSGWC